MAKNSWIVQVSAISALCVWIGAGGCIGAGFVSAFDNASSSGMAVSGPASSEVSSSEAATTSTVMGASSGGGGGTFGEGTDGQVVLPGASDTIVITSGGDSDGDVSGGNEDMPKLDMPKSACDEAGTPDDMCWEGKSARLMFFTSGYRFRGNLMPPPELPFNELGHDNSWWADRSGVQRADQICRDVARERDYHGEFLAWVSGRDGSMPVHVASRISSAYTSKGVDYANLLFTREDGGLIAESWLDLTDGALAASIADYSQAEGDDECDKFRSMLAWTGSDVDGLAFYESTVGSMSCQGWESADEDKYAAIGSSIYLDHYWSVYGVLVGEDGCLVFPACNFKRSLYCIQIG